MADDLHHLPPPPIGSSKTMGSPKYKKAPDAPKRFKSAFIIFSAEKHKEIKEKLASEGRVEKVRIAYQIRFRTRIVGRVG